MRSLLITVLALLSSTGLAAAGDQGGAAPAHPDLIIVRQFATRGPIVALDPSLGFSLYRGAPGVPPGRRAASVARATAFTLAETIAQQLRNLGYDAVQSNETGPEPGGRALIVSGAFRSINEGHRRRLAAKDASVAVVVEVEYQTEGAQPQRQMAIQLGSRQIQHEALLNAAAHRELGLNSATIGLGVMIARAIAELAHRTNWPGAPLSYSFEDADPG